MEDRKNQSKNRSRTQEEMRELGRLGGRASGEARRRRKIIRKAAALALKEIKKELPEEVRQLIRDVGIREEETDMMVILAFTMARKAVEDNDPEAARVFLEMMEDAPEDESPAETAGEDSGDDDIQMVREFLDYLKNRHKLHEGEEDPLSPDAME